VAGGVKGGVAGGVVGGVVGAAVPSPKFLPPQMGAQRKLSGADPDFPAVLRRQGAMYLVMAKICVGVAGNVDSVTLQKRAEPTLDGNVIAAVKGWRFQPMTANGTPVPFCYFGRFEFKSD
jgi:protein TonB